MKSTDVLKSVRKKSVISKPKKLSNEEFPISSFDGFLKDICGLARKLDKTKDTFLIYRGQREVKPLVPKLGRFELSFDEILQKEKEILNDFKRRGFSHSSNHLNEWDQLAAAQHYGLPTRLLDWTENPLTAAFFAFEKEEVSSNRVIWAFLVKPSEDCVDITNPAENPFAQTKTKVFRPNHVNQRIVAQNGWFTVHKAVENKGFINFEEHKSYKNRIVKIVFPDSMRSDALSRLNTLGINHASLFPDLAGLCSYLQWLHFGK